MNCRYLRIATVLCLLCSLAQSAEAETSAHVQKTLQGVYNARNAAAAHKNLPAFLGHVDHSVRTIATNGAVGNYSLMRDLAKRMFAVAKSISIVTTIHSCSLVGNGATVVINEHSHSTLIGRHPRRTFTITESGTIREYWVKSSSGWRLKRSRIITEGHSIE